MIGISGPQSIELLCFGVLMSFGLWDVSVVCEWCNTIPQYRLLVFKCTLYNIKPRKGMRQLLALVYLRIGGCPLWLGLPDS